MLSQLLILLCRLRNLRWAFLGLAKSKLIALHCLLEGTGIVGLHMLGDMLWWFAMRIAGPCLPPLLLLSKENHWLMQAMMLDPAILLPLGINVIVFL